MIYAIIIILALAIAFIILIRRLPGAFTPGQEPKTAAKNSFSFKLPAISMPKLPSLPKREPKAEPIVPVTPVVTPVSPPAPVAAPKAAFKMPTFSLPTRKKEEPLPPLPVEQPVPTKATTSSDFWEQNDSPKPISEPAPVVATVKDSKPAKGKNVTDEADTAFTARDYRKAEKLYVRLAAEDPKNPKIYSRLGIIYLEQSNFEDARDAFQQAIKLEPGVATRHFNLALVYMHLGSKAKATSAMELALKYDPSNRKYRKMLDNIMAGRV